MSENWAVTEHGTTVLRKYAVFDFKGLLPLMWQFSKDAGYRFIERDYNEKIKGDGSEVQWKAFFERKVTDFVFSRIRVEMWIQRMVDVEVNGKRLKKGDVEITFDARMEMDWQNRWERSRFTKFLRFIYIYYLRKPYFLNMAGKLSEELFDLYNRVKKHLDQINI